MAKRKQASLMLVYSCPLGRPCAAGMLANSRDRVDSLAFMRRTLVQSRLGIRKILRVCFMFQQPAELGPFCSETVMPSLILLKDSVTIAECFMAAL